MSAGPGEVAPGPHAAPPRPARSGSPAAGAGLAAGAALVIFAALFLWWRRPFVDDAYITYRYAANWAAGLGPVYNPGQWVEGFSCFLWMALLALGARLGADPVTLGPRLNLVIGAATLILMARLCLELGLRRARAVATALTLALALSAGFSFYAAAGMDTPLFTLAMLAAILALTRAAETGRHLDALPALMLLELSRVEGFAYALLFTALAMAVAWREGRGARLRRTLPLALALAAGTALLFAARHAVYGLWISTTVISKGYATYLLREALEGGGRPALQSLYGVLRKGLTYEAPLLGMGIWIPWLLAAASWRRAPLLPILLAASTGLGCAIGLWSGGDWMPYGRFLVVLLPAGLASLAWVFDRARHASEGRRWRGRALGAAAVVVALTWAACFVRPMTPRVHDPVARSVEFQRDVGRVLGTVPPPVTLATNTAGQIAYYAGPRVTVRDLLGLTDRHNALAGTTWYVRFGRADYDYTFSPPLDLFHSNAWVDMEELVRYCDAHPAARQRFRFLVVDEWLRASFLVAGDPASPAVRALDRRYAIHALAVERPTLDSLHAEFRRQRDRAAGGGTIARGAARGRRLSARR